MKMLEISLLFFAPLWIGLVVVVVSCVVAKMLGRGHASAFWGLLGVLGWIVAARKGSEGQARQRRAFAIRRKHRRRFAHAA